MPVRCHLSGHQASLSAAASLISSWKDLADNWQTKCMLSKMMLPFLSQWRFRMENVIQNSYWANSRLSAVVPASCSCKLEISVCTYHVSSPRCLWGATLLADLNRMLLAVEARNLLLARVPQYSTTRRITCQSYSMPFSTVHVAHNVVSVSKPLAKLLSWLKNITWLPFSWWWFKRCLKCRKRVVAFSASSYSFHSHRRFLRALSASFSYCVLAYLFDLISILTQTAFRLVWHFLPR